MSKDKLITDAAMAHEQQKPIVDKSTKKPIDQAKTIKPLDERPKSNDTQINS